MSTALITVLLLIVITLALIFVGQQVSSRYPESFPRLTSAPPQGMKRHVEHLQTGAFVVMDYASDLIFPGPRKGALDYKQKKRSVGSTGLI